MFPDVREKRVFSSRVDCRFIHPRKYELSLNYHPELGWLACFQLHHTGGKLHCWREEVRESILRTTSRSGWLSLIAMVMKRDRRSSRRASGSCDGPLFAASMCALPPSVAKNASALYPKNCNSSRAKGHLSACTYIYLRIGVKWGQLVACLTGRERHGESGTAAINSPREWVGSHSLWTNFFHSWAKALNSGCFFAKSIPRATTE